MLPWRRWALLVTPPLTPCPRLSAPLHPSPSHLLSFPPSIPSISPPSISTRQSHSLQLYPSLSFSSSTFPSFCSQYTPHPQSSLALSLLTHKKHLRNNKQGNQKGTSERRKKIKRSETNETIRPSLIPINKLVFLGLCFTEEGKLRFILALKTLQSLK